MAKRFFDSLTSRLFLVVAFSVSAIAGMSAASAFDYRREALRKDEENLTLILDEDTDLRGSEAAVLTALGNEIRFELEGYASLTDGFESLNPHGSLKNATAISGLGSLAITFKEGETDSLALSYGWDEGCSYASGIALSALNNSASFSDSGPSYFKIENASSIEAVDILAITILYSCAATGIPSLKSGGVTYSLNTDKGSYTAASFDGKSSSVSFLNSISERPVTAVGNNFLSGYGSGATNLLLPPSITKLGSSAFYGSAAPSIEVSHILTFGDSALSSCTKLTAAALNSSLTAISGYCFAYCSKLSSIFIPISVLSVGHYAFNGCSSLAIRCQAASKPSGWDSGWNPSNRPVTWGALA
jgi:hypothetical protein